MQNKQEEFLLYLPGFSLETDLFLMGDSNLYSWVDTEK